MVQECIAAAAAERKKQKSLVTEPTVAFKVCGHCKQRKVGRHPSAHHLPVVALPTKAGRMHPRRVQEPSPIGRRCFCRHMREDCSQAMCRLRASSTGPGRAQTDCRPAARCLFALQPFCTHAVIVPTSPSGGSSLVHIACAGMQKQSEQRHAEWQRLVCRHQPQRCRRCAKGPSFRDWSSLLQTWRCAR